MAKPKLKRPAGPPAPAALWQRLFEPVDIASLVFMRVAFGLLLAWEAYRYLLLGRVATKYADPVHLIGWAGFEWVQRWPGDGMYWHFYALLLLALCIAVGFLYRLSCALFCLGFSYVFLISQAAFQNHFYLICLFSFLLTLAPAHRSFSMDARLRPGLRSETVPAWSLWLLRAQLGVLYFYGGIAKLNGDWLQGYPMRLWLPARARLPVLDAVFLEPWVAILMSWAGVVIDLFALPALLWRRTRPFAFAVLVTFHLWNNQIFHIGVFPWLAIASTAIFFPPDWPRRIFRWPRREPDPPPRPFRWSVGRRAVAAFVCTYLALQVLLPLRHFLYEGNASWTEEGHPFAWRMMLRSKKGILNYVLTDRETGESWWVNPQQELGASQHGVLSHTPRMIHLYARHLAELASEDGHPRVSVRALGITSMNGREPEPLVDPLVDLGAQPLRHFGHAPWVLSYSHPLGIGWREKYKDMLPEADEPQFD